jgi:hypothetical protein
MTVREKPRTFRSAQAVRKAGPVIRIRNGIGPVSMAGAFSRGGGKNKGEGSE